MNPVYEYCFTQPQTPLICLDVNIPLPKSGHEYCQRTTSLLLSLLPIIIARLVDPLRPILEGIITAFIISTNPNPTLTTLREKKRVKLTVVCNNCQATCQ
jgi:hypothetical protein